MTMEKHVVTQNEELLRQILSMLEACAEGMTVLRDLSQSQYDQHSERWQESEYGRTLRDKIGTCGEALDNVEAAISLLKGVREEA